MSWIEFIGAGLVFLITHRVPTIPSVRSKIVGVIGERGFLIAYSALSIVVLTWLIIAAGRAPFIEVWATAAWQYWAPNIAMPVVCILIGFSVAAPNPLSFGGGRSESFDPNHPGFAGITRHGLLWALALWSGSHVLPNGDLAHVILFGSFCAFSFLGMRIIDRRRQRQMGMDAWQAMARTTSVWPFQALMTGRWKPRFSGHWKATITRLFIACIIYLGLLMAHADVMGVSPLVPRA